MDFDKPKVYGDTFISDGLVFTHDVSCLTDLLYKYQLMFKSGVTDLLDKYSLMFRIDLQRERDTC